MDHYLDTVVGGTVSCAACGQREPFDPDGDLCRRCDTELREQADMRWLASIEHREMV